MFRRIFHSVALLVLIWFPGRGTDAASFTGDVAPILLSKCVACHGSEKSRGDFRLDTFDFLMMPGSSEWPSVVAGQPDASLLLQLIVETDEDDRMPQEDDPLSADQIAVIEAWIRAGAVFDGPGQKAPLASYAGPSDHPAPPPVYEAPVPILSLAFSPNGRELAVGGYHEILVWNPEQGRLRRRLTNIAERVYGLAWSSDNRWLAVAGGTPGRGGDVRVVNPSGESASALLVRTVDSVLGVRFSPDETRLAGWGADNAVRLFDTADWSERLVIEQHADWVMDVRFDDAGRRLATASRDKSARVFDAVTGELIESFFGHEEPVFAALFDPGSERVWSAGRDRMIRGWEIEEAKQKADIGGFDAEVTRLIWSDGDLISVAGRVIYRHEAGEKRKLVRQYEGHEDRVYAVAVSGATGWLASGDHAGEVRLWRLEDGELINRFVARPPAD